MTVFTQSRDSGESDDELHFPFYQEEDERGMRRVYARESAAERLVSGSRPDIADAGGMSSFNAQQERKESSSKSGEIVPEEPAPENDEDLIPWGADALTEEEIAAIESAEEQQEEPAEQAEDTEAEKPSQEEKYEEPAQEESYEEPAGEQEAVPADADDQEEASAEAVEEQQETAVNMPAQKFKKSVKAADINNKKTTVTVMVNAPEGALPEKAGMTVGAVGANDILTGTGRTVLETVKETTEDEVVNLITLEIAFTDADG